MELFGKAVPASSNKLEIILSVNQLIGRFRIGRLPEFRWLGFCLAPFHFIAEQAALTLFDKINFLSV
jgi:hypothetical protein